MKKVWFRYDDDDDDDDGVSERENKIQQNGEVVWGWLDDVTIVKRKIYF